MTIGRNWPVPIAFNISTIEAAPNTIRARCSRGAVPRRTYHWTVTFRVVSCWTLDLPLKTDEFQIENFSTAALGLKLTFLVADLKLGSFAYNTPYYNFGPGSKTAAPADILKGMNVPPKFVFWLFLIRMMNLRKMYRTEVNLSQFPLKWHIDCLCSSKIYRL